VLDDSEYVERKGIKYGVIRSMDENGHVFITPLSKCKQKGMMYEDDPKSEITIYKLHKITRISCETLPDPRDSFGEDKLIEEITLE
jgi:hypothetical protein